MRELVQRKLLDEMLGAVAKRTKGWLILVLDDASTRVISSALTMYDIMERKITLVEQLHKSRQPFPEMDVIYFVSPTKESIQRILADFESPSKAKYANVHIFLLDGIHDENMRLLQKNEFLLERIQTFTESYINFITSESHVFHLDYNECMRKIFGVQPDPNFAFFIAGKLTTLCITMNEHPIIKFQVNSTFAKTIAVFLQQNMIQYKEKNRSFWTYGEEGHQERERSVMVILDRSFDALTPLMHEYTYQALAQDLLEIKDNIIPVKVTTNAGETLTKEAVLNENDDLWLSLRHLHIANVIKNISDRMKEILQTNNSAALLKGDGSKVELSTMAAAVKELPEFRQTMTKLNQHVGIAQQCMDSFTKQGIWELSQLEQFMSTGVDSNNTPLRKPELMQQLVEILENRKIDKLKKLRLIGVLSIVLRKLVTPEEKQALIHTAKLDAAEQNSLKNLERIGEKYAPAVLSQAPAKPKGFFTQFFGSSNEGIVEDENEIADSRHVTALQPLLEKMISGDLDQDEFPNIGLMESQDTKAVAKSARRQGGHTKFGGKKDAYSGSRGFVFIAGGVSYAELRVAYEMMRKNGKEIVIGSTHLITPKSFLEELKTLDTREYTGRVEVVSEDEYDTVHV